VLCVRDGVRDAAEIWVEIVSRSISKQCVLREAHEIGIRHNTDTHLWRDVCSDADVLVIGSSE